ncbi:MAG TPA: hypothetical protein VHK24_01540 [Steroidobacter sp.]|jgi:hypothetical protein|nr:hypothetical protein [Steroidobacter sp.]
MKAALRITLIVLGVMQVAHAGPLECTNWQSLHPEWVWCDDFESDAALSSSYFEVNRSNGFGVTTTTAFGGSGALKATYYPGVQESGNVKLGIGRSPVASKIQVSRNFEDLYWRFYLKMDPNWVGNANKLTRATIFSSSNWAQAAISHLWEDEMDGNGLGLDPVSGVVGGVVVTTKYNDFQNMRWLGKINGITQIYAPENLNRWNCIEVHMKLNTPGASDGVSEFWVDSHLEARRADLNWRGTYTAYGINAIMLENYKNGGPTQVQSRYFDNFVVSTARIGCLTAVRPNPPTDLTVQ